MVWLITATLGAPARIAFVGYPLPHKGWPLYADLVRAAHAIGPYRFYHFGIATTHRPMPGLACVTCSTGDVIDPCLHRPTSPVKMVT